MPDPSSMRIVFASSEAVPFCKTGGLADVAGSLAAELARKGHEVTLFLPLYRAVSRQLGSGAPELKRLSVPWGGASRDVILRRVLRGPLEVLLVDCPEFFDREGLYQDGGLDHPDNASRFALFSRAVLDSCSALGKSPDAFHCHDWQTALIPAYLKTVYASERFFSRCASLFTIHNLSYQGIFPPEALAAAGFPAQAFHPGGLEYYGKTSYLKGGLVYSDLLSTVSPTYAREIQSSPAIGMGMEGVLRGRSADLFGILNGIDAALWDPASDAALPRRFGLSNVSAGKAACKRALQEACGLPVRPSAPLIGAVSRLDPQKGLDLALEVLPPRLAQGAQFVLVGHGDPKLEEAFARFSGLHAGSVYYRKGFDDSFARRVYAACDLFLMPSRFEPCGLGQMIAMRYGALPVATRTGGLADTVFEDGKNSNGFLASGPNAIDLSAALDRALSAYKTPAEWASRVKTAMGADFSWGKAVEAYEDLYRKAVRRRRP